MKASPCGFDVAIYWATKYIIYKVFKKDKTRLLSFWTININNQTDLKNKLPLFRTKNVNAFENTGFHTHKVLDFRDDCTEFILSIFLHLWFSSFSLSNSLTTPGEDYSQGRRLISTIVDQ